MPEIIIVVWRKERFVMKLKCISNSKSMWGNGSNNADVLEVGKVYTVIDKDVHSWHTLYTLDGVKGEFNSCLFEDAPEENQENCGWEPNSNN